GLVDTRSGGQPIGQGGELDVQVTGTGGAGGVPAGATAAVLNVTATKTTTTSFLTVWPAGTSRPLASNLNFGAEQTIANLAVTALSSAGQAAVFNNRGQADVVIDVEGWISTPAGTVSDGRLTPIVPYRIADTRSGQGG